MTETIVSIEEVENHSFGLSQFSMFAGFIVTTSEQVINFGIDNGQSCCENWGYFITNDDAAEFLGAELLDVVIVDECLNSEKAPDIYEGGAMFVDFVTDRGVLQFTAYNEHNGYYSHEAVLLSKQVTVVDNYL